MDETTMPRSMTSLVTALLLVLWAQLAVAESLYGCGPLENAYGPFDYTNPIHKREKLPVVERHHFNRNVAQAIRGVGAKITPGQDLDYTLRAFPNHHGALYAVMLYTLKVPPGRQPAGLKYSPTCYYKRAVTFAPDDATARMVYGLFLNKTGKVDEAFEQYARAVDMAPEYAEAHYNYGLLLLEHDRVDDALTHAQRAYELGFPLDGLKDKLRRAGVWRDDGSVGE